MTRTLRRPRLLSRAAAAGAALYRRERDLARMLPKMSGHESAAVVPALAAAEEACEEQRKAGAASYSITRHVGLLTALVAELGAARAPA